MTQRRTPGRRFRQVDVFTDEPYRGNPVAVVLDAEGLDGERMQEFARWTNLSETTFVLPPTTAGADYRVRIFTPSQELPFAGHPTLGTAHAWLEAGGLPVDPSPEPADPTDPADPADSVDAADVPTRERLGGRDVVQECGVGLIRVRPGQGRLAFAAPPLIRSGPVDKPLVAQLARILRIRREEIVDAEWVDNGPGWVAVLLRDADAVLAVRPGSLEDLDVGVVGPHPPGSPYAVEVRAFFTVAGATVEDPVTGSLHASLAPWLARIGRVTLPYVARQGTALGRDGRAHLSQDRDGVLWVGGAAVTCVSGTVQV